jgi:hypothetical protein
LFKVFHTGGRGSHSRGHGCGDDPLGAQLRGQPPGAVRAGNHHDGSGWLRIERDARLG